MKFIKIPQDRIGVLIGPEGSVKSYIEQKTQTHLEIDSETGEITIDDHEVTNPLIGIKTENIIKAIGRGFSPNHAYALFSDQKEFFLFDIHDYVGKKENHVHRLKSRMIGRNGKTKRYIEKLTGAHLSIYGHTIGVIGDMDSMDITRKAIDMLLAGSKHATVYTFIEREMKKMKLDRLL